MNLMHQWHSHMLTKSNVGVAQQSLIYDQSAMPATLAAMMQ